MAHAYVLVQFTDRDGVHAVGDEVELARTTPEEKANFDRLLDYGIISTSQPRGDE